MDYTQLTPDQQYQTVQQRVRQYEQSHLLATLDLAAATASGETEQAKGFESQVAKWEQAAAAARKILKEMPKPDDDAAPAMQVQTQQIRGKT